MLFYTGITRSADAILAEQKANIPDKLAQLDLLRDLAGCAADALRGGDADAVGVSAGQELGGQAAAGLRRLEPRSTTRSTRRCDAGATGAKVTGAGGGGFVLVMCPVERQEAVRVALAEMKELPIKVDPYGSRVILNVHRDIWG